MILNRNQLLSTILRMDSSASTQHEEPHVLIIGAGITGLTLAQALKSHGIHFTIFERDPEYSYRGRGWGLTIHWALDTFLSLLPQSIIDRLPESYVDPVAVAEGEKANFLFFDLKRGEARWQVPSARRIRVSRERLLRLLMDGVDVKVRSHHSIPSLRLPNASFHKISREGLTFSVVPFTHPSNPANS